MGNDWDRQQSNIDLMVEEMRAGKYDSKAVKVAILDSACTGDKRTSDRINGHIVTAEMPKQLTVENHCTKVASRITMGAPGAEMKSWPLFEDPDIKEIERNLRKYATRACAEGYEVINLSAINEGGPLLVAAAHEVSAALRSRGCILVQASGNDQNSKDVNVQARLAADATARAKRDHFTVGANTINGTPADFSVPATVRAAGNNVPGVNSKGDLSLVSGTSFAAPTVSAIVKNVLTVLKASPKTKGMAQSNPSALADLALKIVKGTATEGTVDGYRAVVLAKAVGKSGPSVLKDKYSIMDVFNTEAGKIPSHGLCAGLPCVGQGNDNQRRTCYNDKRKMLTLNPDNPLDSDIEDLRNTAGATSKALSQQWIDRLSKNPANKL